MTHITRNRHLNVLSELERLEKRLRSRKSEFPVPECVKRLKRIRRLARHIDKLITKANAHMMKAERLNLRAHRAAERGSMTAAKGLRAAARIAEI